MSFEYKQNAYTVNMVIIVKSILMNTEEDWQYKTDSLEYPLS